VTDADGKLTEYEGVIRLLTAKVEELVAENQRLRSETSDALSVCQEVYSDPNASPALRLKAAGLALPHEVPKLMPERAPLELSGEPIIPLADLVTARRARQDALEGQPVEVTDAGVVRVLPKPGSDDSGDDGSSD
jgi:hypothetical protein